MRLLILLIAASAALPGQNVPRAEFPQPQFEREQWMTLNGPWQFEFDDSHAGVSGNWAAGNKKFSRNITVPYCFESKLSGIGDTSFHSEVWYRKSFTVPSAWKGQRVLLKFGAVDYRAWVWLNGRELGFHEGGNVPFSFDITPYLASSGENTVTVRVVDPPTDRYVPRGKQFWEPKSRGIFYTRTTGIWQPVWLEATGSSYVERVRMTPSIDGTLRIEARVFNPAPELNLVVRVLDGTTPVTTASVAVSGERAGLVTGVVNPKLWSVNSPNLYNVELELMKGAVLDRVKSYAGFRSVAVENGRVTLNHRPVYLKFVLDQGYWPDSLLTPPTDEAIQYDIKMTKAMGFNGARKHQKVEDPRFLYWADKMGFLVSGEMANAYEFDEDYVRRFTDEWIEAVERDYNHPSIIIWNAINESWGVPNIYDTRQQQHLRALYTLTKSLDPTRLVIDNEGWEHTDLTDLFAIHDYARNGEVLCEKYKDVAKTGVIPNVSRAALAPGYQYNESPLYLSEFGGIAYIPPGTQVPSESWGYSGVEKTPEAALARLRSLFEAIARLPFVGICYTQLTDVEQEVNGLMTYDRKPKFPVDQVKAIVDLVGR
jgi:beta-galactosidase/beta-glucuronidase